MEVVTMQSPWQKAHASPATSSPPLQEEAAEQRVIHYDLAHTCWWQMQTGAWQCCIMSKRMQCYRMHRRPT
jgi:hypothetical protein